MHQPGACSRRRDDRCAYGLAIGADTGVTIVCAAAILKLASLSMRLAPFNSRLFLRSRQSETVNCRVPGTCTSGSSRPPLTAIVIPR